MLLSPQFKKAMIVFVSLIFISLLILSILYWLSTTFSKSRTQLDFADPHLQERTTLQVSDYAVVAGTPWATDVAVQVLENGGNAIDAAVAAVLMLNITFGEAASFPGVAPVMLYDANSGQVRSYIGAGTAPQKATIEFFKKQGYDTVPELNILSQLIPASPDMIIRLLQTYGSQSFSELVQPAINKAREGFPVHYTMAKNMNLSIFERIGYRILLPTSSEVYFGENWWLPLQHKDRFQRPKLADTLEALANAEQKALKQGATREQALEAVRDYFYKGPIAKKISEFHEQEKGLIQYSDLANYKSAWEKPLEGNYNEYTIYVNSTWSQGIVIPMALQILEGIDLKSMGHNSGEYVHTLAQAIDLSMADREIYVADPAFVDVPIETLLSKQYAQQRRQVITEKAFKEMPAAGRVNNLAFAAKPIAMRTSKKVDNKNEQQKNNLFQVGKDTSQVVVVDKQGNAIAITPSDFPMSPMIPDTGLTLGIRMTQFNLNPGHVNRLEPGKRPRITPHAAIVFRNGEFFMAFNTPGADMQTQALIQVFLNLVVFDMDIQSAINAPRLRSFNFPNSFDPTDYEAGLLALEQSLYKEIANSLKARGYKLKSFSDWSNELSAVGAIVKKNNQLFVGSDPRESATADGK